MSFIDRANKKTWLSIALVNLFIVALLGMMLRSKILFSIPFLDFKYTLHAHSHFAFGGWVSLALMALMIYDILPANFSGKRIYNRLLAGIFINAAGMLVSFLIEGYAFYSILFSTVFICVSYVFAGVFIRDIYRSGVDRIVRLLCLGSILYLVMSSVGPFTLAYLMASKSGNAVLYKDAIYTYLHLQYNGFFTLAVFALLFNDMLSKLSVTAYRSAKRFVSVLVFSVIPSLFLCYLWHYPNALFQGIAIAGSVLMLLSLLYFASFLSRARQQYQQTKTYAGRISKLALIAFVLKMVFQSLTIIRGIGDVVFTNRPVIIGFLHLVLLGFISLFLLAALYQAAIFKNNKLAVFGGYLFACSVIFNELVLMGQGLGVMLQMSSRVYPTLLWLASILLCTGAALLLIAGFLPAGEVAFRPASNTIRSQIFSNPK